MIHPTATIDETVRVYGRRDLLSVGAGSRIDAFCIITVGDGGVYIGERVHLGVGVCLFGSGGRIMIRDGCSLSPRATVFTASDELGVEGHVGPLAEPSRRNLRTGDVTMDLRAAVGAGGMLFPGVTLGKYAVVGALSFAKTDVPVNTVVVGPDAKRYPRRKRCG